MPVPPLTVVQPGEGGQGGLGSIGVVFKLWGHDTGGAVAMVEHPFPPGALVIAAGPPDPADVLSLAGRYGLQFAQPDWLPDLISRYNLNPPPGG